jgi:hypothetical protein
MWWILSTDTRKSATLIKAMAAPTPLSIARGLRPKPRYGQNRDASVVTQRAKWKANVATRGRMSMTSDTGMDRILGTKAGVCAGTCTPLCYPFTIQNLRSSFNGVSDGYQQWTLTWQPVAGTIAIIETQCTSAFSPDSSLISCPSTVSYGTDGASAIVIIPPAPPPNVYPNPRAVLTLLCSSYTASATIRLLS